MDFVLEIPNNLSKEKCEDMIKRFEADSAKRPGSTLSGFTENVKSSTDLPISSLDEWKDIDNYLFNQLKEGLEKYKCHLIKKGYRDLRYFHQNTEDGGYQMQKTDVGQYYSWHDDALMENGRFLTYLWYLTSHDHISQGGGTAFHSLAGDGGRIINPEQGKLLIFPATWTYIHMGLPLTQGKPKYICTGWMHSKIKANTSGDIGLNPTRLGLKHT